MHVLSCRVNIYLTTSQLSKFFIEKPKHVKSYRLISEHFSAGLVAAKLLLTAVLMLSVQYLQIV